MQLNNMPYKKMDGEKSTNKADSHRSMAKRLLGQGKP
jgi:hypothetical protein